MKYCSLFDRGFISFLPNVSEDQIQFIVRRKNN